MKTLQELLQERANVHEQMETLVNTAKVEGRTLTDEEEKQFEALDAQYNELDQEIAKLEKQEERENKLATRKAILDQPGVQNFNPTAVYGAPVQETPKDDGGFANFGEFVHAVRFGDSTGRLDELPRGQGQGGGIAVPEAFVGHFSPSKSNEWQMGVGQDGGFAVPEQFDTNIRSLNHEGNIVRSRATVIPAGDPADGKLTIPALAQGSNGVFGGVEVAWINEGEEKPETDAKLREITLEPHEVAATTVVTDKLLRNWKAASSFIGDLLSKAMFAAEDMAFLTGNGTGKPTGVIGSAGAKVVNRKTASQISYEDIVFMIAALYPESQSRAIFVANLSILPQIATLKDGAGNYIFIQGDATRGIPSTLAGFPIHFTGKTPTLGKKGDLILVDFENYLIKDGSGPYIAASEHVLFRQNKTVIKVFWNVDGKPWVNEPLKLEDGETTVSPYVVLDVPAIGD